MKIQNEIVFAKERLIPVSQSKTYLHHFHYEKGETKEGCRCEFPKYFISAFFVGGGLAFLWFVVVVIMGVGVSVLQWYE